MNGADRCDQLTQLYRRHAVVLRALSFTHRKLHSTQPTTAEVLQVRSVIANALREATR